MSENVRCVSVGVSWGRRTLRYPVWRNAWDVRLAPRHTSRRHSLVGESTTNSTSGCPQNPSGYVIVTSIADQKESSRSVENDPTHSVSVADVSLISPWEGVPVFRITAFRRSNVRLYQSG